MASFLDFLISVEAKIKIACTCKIRNILSMRKCTLSVPHVQQENEEHLYYP